MSYPTNDITTEYLDSGNDPIGSARVELYTALLRLSELIDSRATSDGLCPLDSNSQVPAINMPTTFTSGGGNPIHLQPGNSFVSLQGVLSMQPFTVAELAAKSNPAGTIAYCSDGDSGTPCLAIGSGTFGVWYRVSLGSQIST